MLNGLLQAAVALAPVALVQLYFSTHRNWQNVREAIWIAFGLGVVVAIPIAATEFLVALPFQSADNLRLISGVRALVVAAIPEETGKLLVLVYLVMRHEDFSRPVHAIALATAVSLGFAAIENVLYVVDAPDWAATALARSFTALPMHAAAGLVMGYFASRAVANPHHRGRYAALMLAAPIALHAGYDYPVFVLVGMGAFSGIPITSATSPYLFLFTAALAVCIAAMIAVAVNMHNTARLPAAVPIYRRRR